MISNALKEKENEKTAKRQAAGALEPSVRKVRLLRMASATVDTINKQQQLANQHQEKAAVGHR